MVWEAESNDPAGSETSPSNAAWIPPTSQTGFSQTTRHFDNSAENKPVAWFTCAHFKFSFNTMNDPYTYTYAWSPTWRTVVSASSWVCSTWELRSCLRVDENVYNQDVLRQGLGSRISQTRCHLNTLLDWNPFTRTISGKQTIPGQGRSQKGGGTLKEHGTLK